MLADSSRESRATRRQSQEQPDWKAKEPDLFRPLPAEWALAQLPKGEPAKDSKPAQPAPMPDRETAEAELKKLEAAKADGKPFDKAAYMKFHAYLGTMDMKEGKLDDAKEHFKKADAEFKVYFEEADKVIEEKRKKGEELDPAFEKNYQIAVQNYMQMVRNYGRTVMVQLKSYNNEAVPDYADKPKELEAAIKDRKDIYEAYERAVNHAGKLKFDPMLLVDVLQDKGLNAAMLADDLYRPLRLKQEVKDIPKWRVLKEVGIRDLTAADEVLDKVLGPKDKKLDVDKEKREKPPDSAFEMRAKVLGWLGKIETERSNDPEDKFADNAGKHFVQAITAWDEYAPLKEDSKVLRSKPVYANLLQLYSDYSLFTGVMAAKHPDPKVQAFMLAQWSDAQTNIANNRRLVTNVPR